MQSETTAESSQEEMRTKIFREKMEVEGERKTGRERERERERESARDFPEFRVDDQIQKNRRLRSPV